MKKCVSDRSALFIKGMIAIFAVVLVGCGGSTPDTTCRTGSLKASTVTDTSQACMIETDTTTSTSTDAGVGGSDAGTGGTAGTPGTGGSVNTGGTPGTGGSTATSTWQPNADCSEEGPSSVNGAAGIQIGAWIVNDWTICIQNSYSLTYDNPKLRKVEGYGYKTSEFTGEASPPPSLVGYSGVMGTKCVLVVPVTVNSAGPDFQGNGVQGSLSNWTVSDGTTTAYMVDNTTRCPFDYRYIK